MLSLHENITPQILTFMHELPFFPSYFVWIPFCFCRGFVFAVGLFLPWNPFCFCRGFVFDLILTFSVSAVESFLFLPWICFYHGYLCVYSFFLFVFLFSPLFLLLSPTKSEKRGSFLGKSPSFFGKSPSFFGGYSLTSNV